MTRKKKTPATDPQVWCVTILFPSRTLSSYVVLATTEEEAVLTVLTSLGVRKKWRGKKVLTFVGTQWPKCVEVP